MSETHQVSSDLPLTVTMSAAQWQRVLMQLAKGSIEHIGPVYGEIERQCQAQIQQHLSHQRANGEAHPDA